MPICSFRKCCFCKRNPHNNSPIKWLMYHIFSMQLNIYGAKKRAKNQLSLKKTDRIKIAIIGCKIYMFVFKWERRKPNYFRTLFSRNHLPVDNLRLLSFYSSNKSKNTNKAKTTETAILFFVFTSRNEILKTPNFVAATAAAVATVAAA